MPSPPLLHWLPALTEADADAALAAIRQAATPADKLARLAALAGCQLDFVQTGRVDRQLERALAELPATQEPPGLARIRVAWLGSSTLEHLVPSARVAGLRRQLLVESYVAPYGQYRQELLDPGSELARFRPHVVLLALDPEHVAAELPMSSAAGDVDAHVGRIVDDLRALWVHATERLGCQVIQQTIPNVAPFVFGSFDASLAATPSAVLDRLNRRLVDTAAALGIPLLDIASWSARHGHDAWFDPVRWLHAKQLVAPAIAPFYGELVARLLAALRGTSKKCLVLDLDNTLWGGVVGDDGVDRLALGPGSAAGEAFARFQAYAKKLKERGVVLAVCSKNDAAVAESAFASHPDMVLRRSDFAVFVANWTDKATNLRAIADTLQLGLDALVFFDDNPAERALVRAELPMVAVPEVPADPAHFARALYDAGYFEAASFTADDLARAGQYQDNARRVEAQASATDLGSFLRGLDMKLAVGVVDDANLARVTQLINKTNQFNVTTRRTTEPELRAFARQAEHVALHFRLADKFGDNGLIAVLLARGDTAGGACLVIDTLLMSCRVLGRGVELAAMNVLVEHAARRHVREIIGEYIPTKKNGMVAELYARLGFTSIGEEAGVQRWRLAVADYARHATFIEVGDAK